MRVDPLTLASPSARPDHAQAECRPFNSAVNGQVNVGNWMLMRAPKLNYLTPANATASVSSRDGFNKTQ